MLKIDRENKSFCFLDNPTLAAVSITERYDLQEFIANSPEAFFKEIGQELFLVGKEIVPSKTIKDRIDLLAVDKEGACVVVELKRGNHKMHMLQAISYAGMVAQWESEDLFDLLDEDRQEELVDFLEVEREEVNRRQRIILVAEAYDYALLVAAEWLSEQYGVDVTCCRISVAKDSAAGVEYLVCSNVYPAPELLREAVPRGRGGRARRKVKWLDWDAALSGVTNKAVEDFVRKQLAAGRENYLPKRAIRYTVASKRRWSVLVRNKHAYVWQKGRFEGDEQHWKDGLSEPDAVKPARNGRCLRVHLKTPEDFAFFHESATGQLVSREWTTQSGADDEADDDEE